MSQQQIAISGVLVLTMVFFGWGRWRYDLVAMFSLLACVLSETPIMHIAALTGVITVASAFMNNVGALALLLPIALSFGSLLGGMMTLIGTPPNIIIANIRAEEAGEPFGMFSFAPVGLPIAVVGVAFITFIGWRLIPKERLEHDSAGQLFEVGNYLTEAKVPEGSSIVDQSLGEIDGLQDSNVEVIGVAGRRHFARTRADPADLKAFLDQYKLELQTTATPTFNVPTPENDVMIEGVISTESELIGRGVEFVRRRTGRTVALVGIARNGESVVRRLRQQTFKAGDVLLINGDADTIDQHMHELGLWPLAHRPIDLNRSRRVLLAGAIFAAAIGIGIAGFVSLPIAFLLAIMAYVATGILSPRQIYDDIDWPVIVLLAAMIPVGNALTTTGTTDLVANSLVDITDGLAVHWIIALLLVVTMLLSDVINNAATALVMAPLSIAMANSLGVSSDPFLMSVAVDGVATRNSDCGYQCAVNSLGLAVISKTGKQ